MSDLQVYLLPSLIASGKQIIILGDGSALLVSGSDQTCHGLACCGRGLNIFLWTNREDVLKFVIVYLSSGVVMT